MVGAGRAGDQPVDVGGVGRRGDELDGLAVPRAWDEEDDAGALKGIFEGPSRDHVIERVGEETRCGVEVGDRETDVEEPWRHVGPHRSPAGPNAGVRITGAPVCTTLSSSTMVTLRSARPTDLPAIAALFSERDGRVHTVAVTAARLGHLADDHTTGIVVEHEGRVVAFSGLERRTLFRGNERIEAAYWRDLCVAPAARDQGLYVPLARATIDAASASGVHVTYTANRRRAVFEAHQKLGFRVVHVLDVRARPLAPFTALAALAPIATGWAVDLGDKLVERAYQRVTRHEERPTGIDCTSAPIDAGSLARFERLPDKRRGYRSATRGGLARRLQAPPPGVEYHLAFASRDGVDVGAVAVAETSRRGVRLAIVLRARAERGGLADAFSAAHAFGSSRGAAASLVLDGVASQRDALDGLGYVPTHERYVLLAYPHRDVAPTVLVGPNHDFDFLEHDAF